MLKETISEIKKIYLISVTKTSPLFINKKRVYKEGDFPTDVMTARYLLYGWDINKKFQRTQQVSWSDIKFYIFQMFSEISSRTLFKSADKLKAEYNLFDDYDENQSLCICPLKHEASVFSILNSHILSPDETSILEIGVTDTNYKNNSFMFLFNMGLVSHKDAIILEEGNERKIFDYITGKNAGLLYKTSFGVIVSDKLQKVIIIKKSDMDFSTIGVVSLLDYLLEKSHTYRTLVSGHTIKVTPLVKDKEFNPDDISSLFNLEIKINTELIKEYRQKTGKNDLLYNLLIKRILNWFKTGRTLNFNVDFSEEGDPDAIELFKSVYSSFLSVQGEEAERLFNRLKIHYERVSGEKVSFDFKKNKTYRYEPPTDKPDFENIFDAFIWLKEELNKVIDENE